MQWTVDNAGALGIDPGRVAVAGDSAGGNLSAVVSLLARDAGGPAIAFQMLLYPLVGGSPDLHPSLTDFKDDFGLTEHDVRHASPAGCLPGGFISFVACTTLRKGRPCSFACRSAWDTGPGGLGCGRWMFCPCAKRVRDLLQACLGTLCLLCSLQPAAISRSHALTCAHEMHHAVAHMHICKACDVEFLHHAGMV